MNCVARGREPCAVSGVVAPGGVSATEGLPVRLGERHPAGGTTTGTVGKD
jgi:hypothetical protein